MSKSIKAQRTEVESLTGELAGLEALVAPQRVNVADVSRKHRAGDATADALKEAHGALAAVEYALDQTRVDLEAARVQLAEMESASQDERLLAEVAAGTVAYRGAEREHHAILTDAEQTLVRAIVRSAELTRVASEGKTRAKDAAKELATKHNRNHDTDVADLLARAVNGSEVDALKTDTQVTRWPYGTRQTYKLVSQVKAHTLGVTVTEDA